MKKYATGFRFEKSFKSTMKKVTLLFQNEKDLRRFHMIIVEAGKVEMNIKTLTLKCHCDDRDIQIAVKGFNAKIIE